MAKTKIYNKDGTKGKEIEIPNLFNEKVREDIISKVLDAKRRQHPYGPSPLAGKQHSASGKLRHRKSVFKSIIGRGSSRVPRKILLNRGAQFHWEAAAVPHARGGRRAHPPKPVSRMNFSRVNKKENQKAMISAISATSSPEEISKKYSSINKDDLKNINFPIIVSSEISSLKTKDMNETISKILSNGEKEINLTEIALRKKKPRSGKGKYRGRKSKKSAGLLLVKGENEEIKNQSIEIINAKELGIKDLAKGGPGRLTVYTEKAIKELSEKMDGKKKESEKSGGNEKWVRN